MRLLKVVPGLLFALAGVALAGEKEFDFAIRICEGDSTRPHFGEDAEEHWNDCETPLEGVPVVAVAGESEDGPTNTGADGIVRLGPLTASEDLEARVAVACTTHVCATLKMSVRDLQAGTNYLIWRSPRLPKSDGDR